MNARPSLATSLPSAIQSVFELHVFLHVEENARVEFSPLASWLRSGGGARTNCFLRGRFAGNSAGIFFAQRSLPMEKPVHSNSLRFGSSGRIRTLQLTSQQR